MNVPSPGKFRFGLNDATLVVALLSCHFASCGAAISSQHALCVLLFGLSQTLTYWVFRRSLAESEKRILDTALAVGATITLAAVWVKGRFMLVALAIGVKTINELSEPLKSWYGVAVVTAAVGVCCSITLLLIRSLVRKPRAQLGRFIVGIALLLSTVVSWNVVVSITNVPISP